VVIVVEATSRGADGVVTCLNRSSIFLRGCVAPGAPSAPASVDRAPDRPPDYEIEQSTFPQQPLLYRLCGDKSPLHVDPEVARRAGFERPILHGLCTYGIACKAVVDHVLDGDVSAIENYRVRFAGVVFPGETIVVRCWCEKDVLAIRASVKEGGRDVLTHASIELNDDALSRARP
jgi:acyl dehydratase